MNSRNRLAIGKASCSLGLIIAVENLYSRSHRPFRDEFRTRQSYYKTHQTAQIQKTVHQHTSNSADCTHHHVYCGESSVVTACIFTLFLNFHFLILKLIDGCHGFAAKKKCFSPTAVCLNFKLNIANVKMSQIFVCISDRRCL